MPPVLRLGTRRSRLALAQSGMMRAAVAQALCVDTDRIEMVEIVTTGDRIQDRRLLEVGGKALFTKEIEQALLDDRIDLAVHSMKDVPAEQPPGLAIAAIPEREDAADAFVSERFARFADLPQGARLGTASLRRQAQALALRPDLDIQMLRGNVDTRLQRLRNGDFEAILLAAAGLNRLGLSEAITQQLPLDDFLPAPGQGALALQVRVDRLAVHADWIAALNHPATAVAVAAERGAMTALEGSCRTAIGAHAGVDATHGLSLTVEILAHDGSARWRRLGQAPTLGAEAAEALGLFLGQQVRTAAVADGLSIEAGA